MSDKKLSHPTLQRLYDVAAQTLELARSFGATDADCMAGSGTEFDVTVNSGSILHLNQSQSKALGLRVFVEGRVGMCRTGDFRPDSLKSAVERAVVSARVTDADPLNGLAEATPGIIEVGPDLDLYDPKIAALSTEDKIRWAHELEAAARSTDPRVRKFRESGVHNGESASILVTSRGVVRASRASGISIWSVPVAEDKGELQSESWSHSANHLEDLEPLEHVGKVAGHRAARMLGARPVPTQRCSVVFEPEMSVGLLGGIVSGIDGDMIYKKASFLLGKLNERIAVKGLNIEDDPTLRRSPGSAPFDDEGLPTYKKWLVQDGVLKTYLYDAYTARKAGAKPTSSGHRGLASMPSAGTFNFIVKPGTDDPKEIIRSIDKGLLLTRGMGSGVNTITGEYSRGANGLWIERGEIAFPVQEVTIASHFLTILQNIDRIGSDFVRRGSSGGPTIRVADMTLGGSSPIQP